MGRIYNIHEALRFLMELEITHSGQVLTRWLREGRIRGERSANLKEGWRIQEEDLIDFIRRSDKEWSLLKHEKYMSDLKETSYEDTIGYEQNENVKIEERKESGKLKQNEVKEELVKEVEKTMGFEQYSDKKLLELKIEVETQIKAYKDEYTQSLKTYNEDINKHLSLLVQQVEKLIQESNSHNDKSETKMQFKENYKEKFIEMKNEIKDNKLQISDLKEQYDKLTDELKHLNETINNLLDMNKSSFNQDTQSLEKTFEEFIEIVINEEIVPREYLKTQEAEVRKMYDYYFEEGWLKEKFINKTDGSFFCPKHQSSTNRKEFNKFIKIDMPKAKHLKEALDNFKKQGDDEKQDPVEQTTNGKMDPSNEDERLTNNQTTNRNKENEPHITETNDGQNIKMQGNLSEKT